MAGASSGSSTRTDWLAADWSPPLTLNVVCFTPHVEGQRRTMWLSGWSQAGVRVVLKVEVLSMQEAGVSTTAGQGATVVGEQNPWDSLYAPESEPEWTPANE